MVCLSVACSLTIALVLVTFVSAAPGRFHPFKHTSTKHHIRNNLAEDLNRSTLWATEPTMKSKQTRLSSRSFLRSEAAAMPKDSALYDQATVLLEAVNLLRSDTASIVSSLIYMKQKGQLGGLEELGEFFIFQLAEWQKHATALPLVGDLEKLRHASGDTQDLRAAEHTFENIIGGLKEILLEVNLMIRELPVIGYILGPMIYNIKTIIDEIRDLSETPGVLFLSKFNLQEDSLMCHSLDQIRQFC